MNDYKAEIKKIFLMKKVARRIMKLIGHAGLITQVDEVSPNKVLDADTFRIVIFHPDLKLKVEKITGKKLKIIKDDTHS